MVLTQTIKRREVSHRGGPYLHGGTLSETILRLTPPSSSLAFRVLKPTTHQPLGIELHPTQKKKGVIE